MITKYKTDLNETDTKARGKLLQFENENLNLKSQLKLLHDDKVASENKYKNEIENLRGITKDLHERLGESDRPMIPLLIFFFFFLMLTEKYSNGEVDSETLVSMKEALLAKDTNIHDLNGNIESLEKQLNEAREEVRVLQETVHHECLERQELHDRLEETREELLNLKKTACK